MRPRVWHVNSDHLWTGVTEGFNAALDDYKESSKDESTAVKVIKYDDFIKCHVPIDWERIWYPLEDWLIENNDSISEREKIQQLVEKQFEEEK